MSQTRVILLSCGSYNPPTNMHLRIFEIARDHLHRMGTHVVVGGVISPVHDNYGKKELANSEHRCAMLKCALQNSEWIRVSTWETRQNNWTPTRLVLQHHQNLLNTVLLNSADMMSRDLEWVPENVRNSNDRTPIQIKLLCGADLLESFGVPGLWAEEDIDAIVGQHGLVVITREGSNPNKFIYDSDILSRHMYNIYIVTEWICNEISSTKIRRALKRGESVRYLIQDPVIEYVQCHGLYNTKTSTKLTLSSTNNSNNYLHIDSKYESAFLTPSPSDITMATPSPVEIISIDIAESVIKKNSINLPKSRVTTITTSTIGTTDDAEFIREKFMNVIQENGNKISPITPKSSYPGQAKQIIATETGESQIFREVGSHHTGTNIENNCIDDMKKSLDTFNDSSNSLRCEIEDNTKSSSNIEVDGNIMSLISDSETIRPDFVVVESNETSQEDIGDSLQLTTNVGIDEMNIQPDTNAQKNTEFIGDKISPPLSTSETTEEKTTESPSEHVDKQILRTRKSGVDSSPQHDEIDGKYLKSMVNSRKSPKRGNNLTEQVVPKMKDAKHFTKQKIQKNDAKNLNSIPPKSESTRKNYLGSLESLNASKPTILSKKSKSFEFIKADFSLKEIDINVDADEPNSPQKSSSSLVATVNEVENVQHDNETIDEFCSVCCYGKNQSGCKNLYTVHSNNSSPLELDSTECDLCSSCNLQDSGTAPGEPQCELCEICGDVAMDMDVVASSRPETDELIDARIFAGARHLPLSVAKQKLASGRLRMEGTIFDITDEDVDGEDADDETRQPSHRGERLPSTSVEEYSADDSTLDDVEFEIENCGLETEASQSLIKTTSVTPMVVENTTNEELNPIIEDVESKRMTRGSSLITRSASRPDSKRRYSSVDNLPSSKEKLESPSNVSTKLIAKNQSKVARSVDNIRVSRITKNQNKLRKSADDVAKSSQDANECQEETEQSLSDEKNVKTDEQQSDEHRVGPDTVQFIIGYNKTCMPTVRQIVDCLVAAHPMRPIRCGSCLLAAKNTNNADTRSIDILNCVSSTANNNINVSEKNMCLKSIDNTNITLVKNCSRNPQSV